MARLHGFQCDRCGCTYDKNRSKDIGLDHETKYNLIGIALVNTAKQLRRVDLCDECLNEVQEWLNNPFLYVTSDESISSEDETGEEEDEE